ncbi:hypothetical protein D3C85_1457570 [compost metagenome]
MSAPVPVNTKIPVPMMAPIPIITRSTGPSTLRNPSCALTSSMASMFLVRNRLMARAPTGVGQIIVVLGDGLGKGNIGWVSRTH